MVYSGNTYTVVPASSWPVALSPTLVTAQVVAPMAPQSPATVQFNFSGDDMWTQFVLFLNAGGTLLTKTGTSTGPNQIGWTISQNPVGPQYFPIRLPSGTAGVQTVYQPQGKTIVADSPVFDYTGAPVLVSDFMSGRYQASFLFDPTDITAELRLLDLRNNGAQVWSSGTPFSVGGLPKNIQCEMLGIYDVPITFTQGRFRALFNSTASTVQSGPNQGQQIAPVQLKAVLGNPAYTDPSTGWVYQYNPESGEQALNFGATVTDVSPATAPGTILQVDATPIMGG